MQCLLLQTVVICDVIKHRRELERRVRKSKRERVTIDELGNIGVGKYKADLTLKDYDDILYMKGKMSDLDVRKW